MLSAAPHLDGSTVPALIRFSNGSGNPKQRDGAPGVRGMAVKFTLPDGSTTDVSAQTARLFVSSTPEGFIDLLKAMRPGLTTPLRLATHLLTHPRLLGALPLLREANRIPASYATTEYHGLHAFRWIAADGSARFVRYHLVPTAAEEYLSASDARGKGRTFSPTSWRRDCRTGRCGSTSGCRSPGPRTRRWTPRRPGRARRSSPSAP